MTDRELMELAARAAGYRLDGLASRHVASGVGPDDYLLLNDQGGHSVWNPLTDDADAFRLAVDLGMNVFQSGGRAYALPSDDDGTYEEQVSYRAAGGRREATRRAIVRAAAKIGESA